jgi:hypothetical protein
MAISKSASLLAGGRASFLAAESPCSFFGHGCSKSKLIKFKMESPEKWLWQMII